MVGRRLAAAPGEISLAHHGVLFLDDLPEFPAGRAGGAARAAETGQHHDRAGGAARAISRALPAGRRDESLPLRLARLGRTSLPLHRRPGARYQGRLSGPLLDRIDLHVEVPALGPAELLDAPAGEPTAAVQARAVAARDRALQRQGKANHALHGEEIDLHAALSNAATDFLRLAAARLAWSARSTHRVLKMARTVADLAGAPAVEVVQRRRSGAVPAGALRFPTVAGCTNMADTTGALVVAGPADLSAHCK
jgi:magnesium chelatase family protein